MDTIQLSPSDNIVVLVRSVEPGVRICVAGRDCLMPDRLALGHKLACRDIVCGEKIIKYGVPIGSATRDIAAGEHVHLHNMKSDYLPTYTLEAGRVFHAAS